MTDDTPRCIYRIVTDTEWKAAQECGSYSGNDMDKNDGFIHLSTTEHVMKTANLYFAGRQDVVVLKIAVEPLSSNLKWEHVATRDAIFPHLYNSSISVPEHVLGSTHLQWEGSVTEDMSAVYCEKYFTARADKGLQYRLW